MDAAPFEKLSSAAFQLGGGLDNDKVEQGTFWREGLET